MNTNPSTAPSSLPAHPTGGPRPGTVLVTGGGGFIGSHVCGALLDRGQKVVVVENFDPYYDPALKRAATAALVARAKPGMFELVEGDIVDDLAMGMVFREHRPEGVIHLAARAGVRPSIADPIGYARVNVLGTQVLLEAAKQAGCARFVMASSSSVYGDHPKVPFSEEDDVSCPISPYAATKRSCELIAHAHWHLTRMPTACLRFFTVFGPRQRPDLAISLFMNKIARGEEITLFGDGSTSRDYTFIDDIVRGVLSAYDRVDRHGYRVWNLGHSTPVTLTEMVDTIAHVVGRPARISRKPVQPGDVQRTFADLTRSTRELDFRPETPFVEGVRRQWADARARL